MTGFDQGYAVFASSDPTDPRLLIRVRRTLTKSEADELRARWVLALTGPRELQPVQFDGPSAN